MGPPLTLTGLLAAALALSGCSDKILSMAEPSAPLRRTLEDITFEKLADTAEARAKYPFLVEAFDDIKRLNAEFPGTSPTAIYLAIVERARSGTPVDWAFFQLRGSYFCGTLGCSSGVFGIAPDGSARRLLGLHSHPVDGANSLSRCGNDTSLVIVEGHGMELALAEYRYTDQGFRPTRTYPYPDAAGPPPALPPCGLVRAGDETGGQGK